MRDELADVIVGRPISFSGYSENVKTGPTHPIFSVLRSAFCSPVAQRRCQAYSSSLPLVVVIRHAAVEVPGVDSIPPLFDFGVEMSVGGQVVFSPVLSLLV